jgi:hypothetical protein
MPMHCTNPAALNPLTSAFYFLGAQKSLISRPWGTAAGSFSFVISSLSLIVAIKDFSVTRYAFFPFIFFLCWREGTLFCWASRGQIRGERSSTIKIRGTGTMKSYEEELLFFRFIICNWLSTRWQCSVHKYKKHKHYTKNNKTKHTTQ